MEEQHRKNRAERKHVKERSGRAEAVVQVGESTESTVPAIGEWEVVEVRQRLGSPLRDPEEVRAKKELQKGFISNFQVAKEVQLSSDEETVTTKAKAVFKKRKVHR